MALDFKKSVAAINLPQPDQLRRILRNYHFWAILFLTVFFSALYYGEYLNLQNWSPYFHNFFTKGYPHDIHRALFLIPMLYTAIVFRLRGAVILLIIISCIQLPYSIAISPHEDAVLRTVSFIILAGLATIMLAISEEYRIRTMKERDFMSTLAGSTNALIAVLDKEGRVVSINKALSEIFGYSLDDVKGKFLWNINFALNNAENIKDAFNKVRDSKSTHISSEYLTGKNGERRFIAWSCTAMLDSEGSFDSMLCTGIDITKQKQIESERLHLASIVENSEEAIISETIDGIITSWNKGAKKLYGYTAAEAIGQSISILVSDEVFNDIPDILQRIGRGEKIGYYETTRVRKDGKQVHVALRMSPIKDSEGVIMGASAIGLDITRRKKAEEENIKLMAGLEERVAERTAELDIINKELESFAYSVSHDLRAPLRSIDGFSQALLEEYSHIFDAQGMDYLERILNATQRMGELIDDLLSLSRVTRAQMNYQAVNLSNMAKDIVSELQLSEPHRQVNFKIEDGVEVRGDKQLIRLVMQNLLVNAWKFTSKHSHATIEFGFIKEEGRNIYYVKDDGAGFDIAYADKLFLPFQRLHRASDFEGTGIGLATVQRVIHRHGGSVWAEGKEEQGATFYFTL